ncbi:MAG: ureidoglycolate lyase [Rhizobiaceae bacterium]
MSDHNLQVHLLTCEAFAPFGDVITTEGAENLVINNGTTTRFHDLAKVETAGESARTLINIFRGEPFDFPVTISMMERHPLGSQAFIPLHGSPWLAVVAEDDNGIPVRPIVFLVTPDKSGYIGVNYAANVWHHPLISLQAQSDFLVVDRGGDGNNLEEYFFDEPYQISPLAAV